MRQSSADINAQANMIVTKPKPPKLLNVPVKVVMIAPKPNCNAPNKADAVPAFLCWNMRANWLPVGIMKPNSATAMNSEMQNITKFE